MHGSGGRKLRPGSCTQQGPGGEWGHGRKGKREQAEAASGTVSPS